MALRSCLLVVAVAATACSASPAHDGVAAAGQPVATTAAGQVKPASRPVPPPPPKPDPEAELRTELKNWTSTPYLEGGKTRQGVDNAPFVRAVYEGAFDIAIPASYDEQFHSGKLIDRDKLAPGDLVFFDGSGFGPFRSHWVGLYVGHGDVAIARKGLGVATVHLADAPWTSTFKTARRMPTDPNAPAPEFDRSKYGSDKAALLRDIAQAWSGTLYRTGGTTFDGIGNAEFVRSVYGAVNEAELEGTPDDWTTLGESVAKDKLEPGDIILYGGGSFSSRSAGIYIGNGDFVHAVRGSAVTISQLDDPKWTQAFKDARRIDPDALTRLEEAKATEALARKTATPASSKSTASARNGKNAKPAAAAPATSATSSAPPPAPATAAPTAPASNVPVTDTERQLRAATEEWRGTPYKLGGTTKSGVDCSAFVRAIYLEVYRVELPRTAEEQESLGRPIDRRALQTGDLVFFRTQGMGPFFKSRHVGLYLGNGEFAQASGRRGVTISRLDDYYWNQKYSAARRLPASDTVR